MTVTYDEMRSNAEKLADEVLKANVLRGIEALKEEYGPDFAKYIDLETLDMGDCNLCVVGQLSDKVGEPRSQMIEQFDAFLALDAFDGDYAELDYAWNLVLGNAEADGEF